MEISEETQHNRNSSSVKMASYLEKRGKKKMITTWKRYWFVLDGRLLLYYKSEMEYINLSVCKGSINMGLASCVKPGAHRNNAAHPEYIVDVVTRTQVISLRTKEKTLQEQWLQALLDSMALPSAPSTPVRPMQFRYSMDNLPVLKEEGTAAESCSQKQQTLPNETKTNAVSRQESMLKKIKFIGGQSYGGSLDTILKWRSFTYKVKPLSELDTQKKCHAANKCSTSKQSDEVFVSEDVKSETKEKKDLHKSEEYKRQSQFYDTDEKCNCCESPVVTEKRVRENENQNRSDILQDESVVTNSYYDPFICDTRHDTLGKNNICEESNEKLRSCSDNESEVAVLLEPEIKIREACVQRASSEKNKINHTSLVIDNRYYQKTDCEQQSCEELGDRKSPEERILLQSISRIEYDEPKIVDPDTSEYEYYSKYDPVLLNQNLNDPEITDEPRLPPRPHLSTSPKTETSMTMSREYEEFYENDKKPSVSQSETSQEEKVEVKSSLIAKLKKRHENIQSSSKCRSKSPEQQATKKKRKKSFIRKIFNRYRKKSTESIEEAAEKVEINEDPEYETVEYASRENESSKQSKNATSAIQGHLPSGILKELKEKISERRNSISGDTVQIEDEEEEDYEAVYGAVSITVEVPVKKPVPTPRMNVKKISLAAPDCDSGDDRPSLPPRQAQRPRSPWHDVPSNNSPVYSNLGESLPATKQQCSFDSEIQDELLGSPESFIQILNKWHNADISSKAETNKNGILQPELFNSKFSDNKGLNESDVKQNEPQTVTNLGSVRITGPDNHSLSPQNKFTDMNMAFCDNGNKICDNHTICDKNVDIKTSNPLVSEHNNHFKSDVSVNSVQDTCFSKISDIQLMNNEKNVSVEQSATMCKVDTVNTIHQQGEEKTSDALHSDDYVDILLMNNISSCDIQFAAGNKDAVDIEVDSLIIASPEIEESQVFDSLSSSPKQNKYLIHQEHSLCEEDSISIKAEMVDVESNNCIMQEPEFHTPCMGCEVEIVTEETAKAIKCTVYNTDGLVSEEQVVPVNKRYSDELNTLLAQLADLTSAPLLSPGVTISLIDFLPSKTSTNQFDINELGPIRRRRHSDPDYDVPRPHRSLIKSFPLSSTETQRVNQNRHTPPIEPAHYLDHEKENRDCLDYQENSIVMNTSISPDSLDSPDTKSLTDQ